MSRPELDKPGQKACDLRVSIQPIRINIDQVSCQGDTMKHVLTHVLPLNRGHS